jgi:putative FmdB family regulatory protein
MPTYEYACKACGQHLEIVQSFKDSALTECPACGGPLRKVFGNIGITFKGNGFYKTDSRSEHKGARRSAEAAKSGDTKVPQGTGAASADGGGADKAAAASSSPKAEAGSSTTSSSAAVAS